MFGVAGLGNTVYHPADYALLSHHVPPAASHVFSFHTFAGMVGSAVAPVTLLSCRAWSAGAAPSWARRSSASSSSWCWLRDPSPPPTQASRARGETTPARADAAGACCCRRRSCSISPSSSCCDVERRPLQLSRRGARRAARHAARDRQYGADRAARLNAIGVLVGGWLAGRTRHHGLVAAAASRSAASSPPSSARSICRRRADDPDGLQRLLLGLTIRRAT